MYESVSLHAAHTRPTDWKYPIVSLQVLAKLSRIDDWTFNSFRLAELTGGKPLSTLSFAVLKQSGIVACLKLDEHKLAR